jgi:hypothetical protein
MVWIDTIRNITSMKHLMIPRISMMDAPRYSMSIIHNVIEGEHRIPISQSGSGPKPASISLLYLLPKMLKLQWRKVWNCSTIFSGHEAILL